MANPDIYPNPMYRTQGTPHPASSTDNAFARYDGTTGSLQDSGITADDSDNVAGIGTLGLSGAITQGEDTNINNIFGRVRIDSRATDIAYFSHYDASTSSNYALRQESNGSTILNGSRVRIAEDGGTVLDIDGGDVTFSDAKNIAFNTNTGTQIGTGATQKLAFYGTTPTAQQTGVAVTAAGIHAALVTLGLITA